MSIAFPVGPSTDDVFVHGGLVWVWDGALWRIARTNAHDTDSGTLATARGGTGQTTSAAVITYLDMPFAYLDGGRITSGTELDVDLTSHTAYEVLIFRLSEIEVDTGASFLQFRFSDDGGSTFEADSDDYRFCLWDSLSFGTSAEHHSDDSNTSESGNDTAPCIIRSTAADAGAHSACELTLFMPHNTTVKGHWHSKTSFWDSNASDQHGLKWTGGMFTQTDDITDIRFFWHNAADFDNMRWALFGLRYTT